MYFSVHLILTYDFILYLSFLAHCINEVAATLRKRGEDKYLSVEVDVSTA